MELSSAVPWYRRARRWGQTNITEIDPTRYDIAWWRKMWQETRAQGVIVNAGGDRGLLSHENPPTSEGSIFG